MCMLQHINPFMCLFSDGSWVVFPFYLFWMVVLWMLICSTCFQFFGVCPEGIAGSYAILVKFWRNPCAFFHIFTSPRVYVHTGLSSLHSQQHWLSSGGLGFWVCVCVWFKWRPSWQVWCSICLWFWFLFASWLRTRCCAGPACTQPACPASSPAAVCHPHGHHQPACLPSWPSRRLPLQFTLFSPPFTQEQMKLAPVFLSILDDF